ncbi:MAG: MATE family efflux transporter [Thermoanaerobaculia bacterium]|nr:MATE family efflux transporter [Thermoanaerobaculia bacterium]
MSEESSQATAGRGALHAFEKAPNRTLWQLSVPVLLSLVAEPLTGLVDTAFIARLGATPLAALGVATILLSSCFWIFNFLGIGTQTEVARSRGAEDTAAAQRSWGVALGLAIAFGVLLMGLGIFFAEPLVRLMGADGEMADGATTYLRIRLIGAPFLLATTVAFGVLRGVEDMRTPMWIALAVNALNIALDGSLILGLGPIPAFGIAGAAWATTASQALGGTAAVVAASRRIGRPVRDSLRTALRLLTVGRDLFLRTGFLILFLALATRAATALGAEAGAAHQAIRQVWLLTALALDALAITAQSLVGFYLGSARIALARQVAAVACRWGLVAGTLLAAGMIATTRWVEIALVPPEARAAFVGAWWLAAITQPINAITFVTDGVHWATRDYAYLRNAVLLATSLGGVVLLLGRPGGVHGLTWVWIVTAGWITLRALFGILRIWPGLGGPLSLDPNRPPA